MHLFISDLHLSADRAETVRLFLRFLDRRAADADHLYILGDLFDAWIGDDDTSAPIPDVVSALHRLSDSGTRLWLMHGNRDFLLGDGFCRATGGTLLNDPSLIDLYGVPTLLMHGDLLCSDDLAYQQFRRQVRQPDFTQRLLARSLDERRAEARRYRAQSQAANSLKPEAIMDVNAETVSHYLRQYGARRLIHGHTHRPAEHQFTLDGEPAWRYVLGEWHADRAEIISVTSDGLSRDSFTA
ncbi:MAG: UDP-2,3-diacylglucosamine diphosphatase [Candidatus Thiodiazotropha sp.]